MADADGIEMGREHDGDGLGRLSGDLDLGRRRREYHIDVRPDQLGRMLAQWRFAFRQAELEDNVLAFDIPEIAKAGPQRLHRSAIPAAVPSPGCPIRATFGGCCAQAAPGQATAAPPRSVK